MDLSGRRGPHNYEESLLPHGTLVETDWITFQIGTSLGPDDPIRGTTQSGAGPSPSMSSRTVYQEQDSYPVRPPEEDCYPVSPF